MKELYRFDIKREIEKEVPCVRKRGGKEIESTKKVTEKVNHKVVFGKPNSSDIENAEFFYGQKFNEFINAGFLTRAMLSKKMGDIGGMSSETSKETLQTLIMESVEAQRVIEFYAGAKDLTEEQKDKVREAEKKYAYNKKEIHEYETFLREQFNQTADARAENKLVEWFVLNFSYYEENVNGKKELFPLFEGEEYEEKREYYLQLIEEDNEIKDPSFLKNKNLFDLSYTTLIRVVSIWYNKIGTDQKSIEESLKELFESDEG